MLLKLTAGEEEVRCQSFVEVLINRGSRTRLFERQQPPDRYQPDLEALVGLKVTL